MITWFEPSLRIRYIDKFDETNIYYDSSGKCRGSSSRSILYWRKDGKPGARVHRSLSEFSPIFECEQCKSIGGTRKINNRYDIANVFGEGYYMLCVACWNKYKPLAKKMSEANEIKRLTSKLTREELKWRKSQTPAN